MCEAEAAHDADMADQDAQIQDEYEHDMHVARTTEWRMDTLREITKERAAMVADIDKRIAFAQESIKRDCIDAGKTIKTCAGTVTLRRAYERVSWNSKQLQGLALVFPKIDECKNVTVVKTSAAIKLDV